MLFIILFLLAVNNTLSILQRYMFTPSVGREL